MTLVQIKRRLKRVGRVELLTRHVTDKQLSALRNAGYVVYAIYDGDTLYARPIGYGVYTAAFYNAANP